MTGFVVILSDYLRFNMFKIEPLYIKLHRMKK